MSEERHEELKGLILTHIQSVFDELEEEMAMSHQEKYALLEDALQSASDEDELRVAFEQWFNEHSSDLGWDFDFSEIWDQATGGTGGIVPDEHVEDDDEDVDEKEDLEGYGFGEEEDDAKKDNDDY